MRWWWVPEMTSSHACLGSINGENLIWRNGTVGESEGFSHSGAVVLATAEQRYKVGKGLSWPWGWGSGRCVDVRCSLGTHLVVQSRSGLAAKAGLPESQVSSNKSRGLDVCEESGLLSGSCSATCRMTWLDKAFDLPEPRLFHLSHGLSTSCPA